MTCLLVASVRWPAAAGARRLDLDERIAAQRAIEEVYWRHRIWPSDNPGPKSPFAEVMPASALRAKVEDYLLQSRALERFWGRPIRSEELQAEVERMTASSRAPRVLQEIFTALGNDPLLVAECLARPLVADRLIRDAYAHDARYQHELKAGLEHSLARRVSVAEARSLGGEYGEAVWMLGGRPSGGGGRQAGGRTIRMGPETWGRKLSRLLAGFEGAQVAPRSSSGSTTAQGEPWLEDLPTGEFGGLQEDEESFFVQAVLEKDSARLRVATVAWRKKPFDEWWARAKATLDSIPSGPDASTTTLVELRAVLPSLSTAAATACAPDTWSTVQSTGAPSPREALTSVWTGTEMIVWGGYNGTLDTNTGGRYTPATDSWTPTSTAGAPEPRDTHTAVWTGTRMVVWGGGNEVFVPKSTGGRYDPAMNSWLPTTTSGSAVPSAREYHTAVWTGSRMIVWGGWDGTRDIDTGGRYDPTADGWTTMTRSGAPSSRDSQTAVWSGTTMVVWGGEDDTAIAQNTGSRYDPALNSWSATSPTGAPAARWLHTAVWTGSRMIVWGGFDGMADLNTGGIYDPSGDAWATTSTLNAPTARDLHVAVWTDSLGEMDIWGGQDDAVRQLSTGGRYNPTTDVWSATSVLATPVGGRYAAAIWSGTEMIVWGGWNQVDLNSGGRYCSGACASAPPAGSSVLSLSQPAGGTVVSWTAVAGAAAFDLVRGSLGALRASGGDFTISTQVCLANDQVATSGLDTGAPPPGDGFWYVVRGLSCGGAGTYDSMDGSQIGSRDSEINASPNSCP